MHVGLTVKAELASKDEAIRHVLRALKASNVSVYIDRERCGDCGEHPELDFQSSPIHALVVIGGDGTIFRAIRELKGRDIPILGVNRGAVGFLAEIDLHEVDEMIPHLLKQDAVRERRPLLAITVERDRETVFDAFALNEAVIAQGAIARLLDLPTTVQGEALTTYRADGLIIATPTGSTAYSLSAGGPIVHPGLAAIILTPLNPHSFSQKPIVLPGDQQIAIEVLPKVTRYVDNAVSLTLDGQQYLPLARNDIVHARITQTAVTFLRRKEDTFIATLRRKLKWGERP